jgi:hypothetical protein
VRANGDDRVTVVAKRLESVEQDSPRHRVQLVGLLHRLHFSSFAFIQSISSSPSCGARPGLVSKSAAI